MDKNHSQLLASENPKSASVAPNATVGSSNMRKAKGTSAQNIGASHPPSFSHEKSKLNSKKQPHFQEESYTLPDHYNSTQLTLVARDPYYIHVYWEINKLDIEEMRKRLDGSFRKTKCVLRMYDVTMIDFNGNNANHQFDIEVGGYHPNSWYVNLWNDNSTYCGEIGVKKPNGEFIPFTRSNFVTTPRANLSDRSDLIWMNPKSQTADDPQPFVYVQDGDQESNHQNDQKNSSSESTQDIPKGTDATKQYLVRMPLSVEEIKAYYARLSPLLRLVNLRRRKNGKFPKELRRTFLAEGSEEALLLKKGFLKEYYKKFFIGSSAELVLKSGASEAFSESEKGGASERIDQKRKFHFELWTELIVHGRTEPDAEVYHQGKKISVRDDGTFSLRYALPEVNIPLHFTACASNKIDKRTINTSVERFDTEYKD